MSNWHLTIKKLTDSFKFLPSGEILPTLVTLLAKFAKTGQSEHVFIFFNSTTPTLFFFIFVFSKQLIVHMPMTGCEQRTSSVRSDRPTSWATITALNVGIFLQKMAMWIFLLSAASASRSLDQLERCLFAANQIYWRRDKLNLWGW